MNNARKTKNVGAQHAVPHLGTNANVGARLNRPCDAASVSIRKMATARVNHES
jgi:hypothetical protein